MHVSVRARCASSPTRTTLDTSTRNATPTTATAEFAAELRASADEWYRQENTPASYEAFGAKNRATWTRIAAAGADVNDEVPRPRRERRWETSRHDP